MDSKLNRLFPTQQQQKRYVDYFLLKFLFARRYVDLDSFPYPCFKFAEDLRSQRTDELVSIHDIVKIF